LTSGNLQLYNTGSYEDRMTEEETTVTKIGSENKLFSDDTVKIALINLDVDFSGVKDVIDNFFPSMRNERLLRYRAETIAKVGLEAYRIAKNENIKVNPIPTKIALPLIEKMSLEHEPEMYEKWANLLIAAGVKPNTLHLQYADILSNLNSQSANFLKSVYGRQDSEEIEDLYIHFREHSQLDKYFITAINEARRKIPKSAKTVYLPAVKEHEEEFSFPLILAGSEKISKVHGKHNNYFSGEIEKEEYTIFTNEEKRFFMSVEKLGLIMYQHLQMKNEKNEDGNLELMERYGVLLTRFGYSFIDCLEHPNK